MFSLKKIIKIGFNIFKIIFPYFFQNGIDIFSTMCYNCLTRYKIEVFMGFLEKDLQKIMENFLFAGSDKEQIKQIFKDTDCCVRSFQAGEVILSPRTPQKNAAVVLKGKAVVNTPDPSKKMLLRFLGAGEPFGIANLFTDEPFVSIVRAHSDCRVFFITENAIKWLLENDSAFLYRYLNFLSGRICYLNAKIGYLTAGSPERRLALYLYSLEKREFSLLRYCV